MDQQDQQNDNETVFEGEVPGLGAKVKVRQKALPWILAAFILGGGATALYDWLGWNAPEEVHDGIDAQE